MSDQPKMSQEESNLREWALRVQLEMERATHKRYSIDLTKLSVLELREMHRFLQDVGYEKTMAERKVRRSMERW